MIQVLINGRPVQIMEHIKGDIDSISVQKHPLLHAPVDFETGKAIRAWLKDIVSRCSGLISYNGTLMYREDCLE